MTDRPTPFTMVFGDLAAEHFPAIADALERAGGRSADRDAFVLVHPVGMLLRQLVPAEAPAEALEAYVRLLHHAYRHWAAGRWVYRVSDAALDRATAGATLSGDLIHPALYVQLPEHRVWRAAAAGETPEPLDGMFVTETSIAGSIAVLGISGMHRHRPGFSAVSVEGRVDRDDATGVELLVEARRDDGSAPFTPLLDGGAAAGIYSLANAGELLLLTCRLLSGLPIARASAEVAATGERYVLVP